MPAACNHADPTYWHDHPPNNGWVTTTCKVCRRFIGRRPVDLHKKPPRKLIAADRKEDTNVDDLPHE